MKKEILRRPFPPEQIKQREGQGGKRLSYVEAHSVIARLNEGCDAWSFEVVEHQVLDEEVVVVARLTADGIVKMAFGGSSITRDRTGRTVSIADDLKSAGTDALKKAASLLGVALELYGASHRDDTRERSSSEHTAAETSRDRLTGRQLSAIQSIARKRTIGRAHLTSMLEQRFRKGELGHLSRREASSLLSELTDANGALR